MNDTKKINGDDPRLTAYALGELSPAERSGVETALRADPNLLKEVDELQKLSMLLEDELSAEPLPTLGSEAREAIEAEARKQGSARSAVRAETAPSPKAGKLIRLPFALKAAAGLLVAATGVGLFSVAGSLESRSAMMSEVSSMRPDADYGGDAADGPAMTPQAGTALEQTIAAPGEELRPSSDPAPARPTTVSAYNTRPVGKTAKERKARYDAKPGNSDRRGAIAYDYEKKPREHRPGEPGRAPTSMRINVGVDEAELADVMEQISRMTGTNIIVDPALRNRRIRVPELSTTNWREAVEVIGKLADAEVRERSDGRVILVPRTATSRSTTDTPFMSVTEGPLSTFSVDVDTASYTTIRKLLKRHTRPNPDSVRIEEMINYFPYDYAPPAEDSEHPFSVHTEVADCPWTPGNKLVRVAIKGREIDLDQRPTSNLVFLLDVSGSMNSSAKLPLLKKSLRMLLEQLGENDRVAIVVYAGASGLALPSTSCNEKSKIMNALERLRAGGSTNGGSGIQLAYHVAAENYIEGGINRVILCTDGDFNVGVRRQGELVQLIEEKAKSNVFLTVLGFGMNHSDKRMESLADKGNGHYAFIDDEREGRKVLVEEMGGTLLTIAKDVKIQVEFNPALVASYRLIGYANRKLKARDFADDTKDAGEIGAGHSVTAFYEIVPSGAANAAEGEKKGLKYQNKTPELTAAADSDELMTVKLRYKQPEGARSTLLSTVIRDGQTRFWDASQDFRFAASVAAFGMLLRDSPFKGRTSFALIGEMAQDSTGSDPQGYRRELIQLVKKTQSILR